MVSQFIKRITDFSTVQKMVSEFYSKISILMDTLTALAEKELTKRLTDEEWRDVVIDFDTSSAY